MEVLADVILRQVIRDRFAVFLCLDDVLAFLSLVQGAFAALAYTRG